MGVILRGFLRLTSSEMDPSLKLQARAFWYVSRLGLDGHGKRSASAAKPCKAPGFSWHSSGTDANKDEFAIKLGGGPT